MLKLVQYVSNQSITIIPRSSYSTLFYNKMASKRPISINIIGGKSFFKIHPYHRLIVLIRKFDINIVFLITIIILSHRNIFVIAYKNESKAYFSRYTNFVFYKPSPSLSHLIFCHYLSFSFIRSIFIKFLSVFILSSFQPRRRRSFMVYLA